MKNRVEERPEGAKFHAVCWENPEDVRCWLTAVKEHVDDLGAAVWDRVRKKGGRVLSRHEARRQATAAMESLGRLFAAAKAGLPPSEPVPEPPEGEESPRSERRPTPPSPGGEAG